MAIYNIHNYNRLVITIYILLLCFEDFITVVLPKILNLQKCTSMNLISYHHLVSSALYTLACSK